MTPTYAQWWATYQPVRLIVPGAPPMEEQAQGVVDGVGDGGWEMMIPPLAQGA